MKEFIRYGLAISVPLLLAIAIMIPSMTLMERDIQFGTIGDIVTYTLHCVSTLGCSVTVFVPACATMLGTQQYLSQIAVRNSKYDAVHYGLLVLAWIVFVHTTIVCAWLFIESVKKMLQYCKTNPKFWFRKHVPDALPAGIPVTQVVLQD